MSPETNSWEVLKIGSACYLGFVKERVKRNFLLSKVSTGNITLHCRQHIACDVWVEWV